MRKLRIAGHGLLLDGSSDLWVGRRRGGQGLRLRESVRKEPTTSHGALGAFGPIRRFLAPNALTTQLLLHAVGAILETLTLGAVEGPETSKDVVSERVAVGLGLQTLAGPAFALGGASVEFPKAVHQPDLLLLDRLNVSRNGGSQLMPQGKIQIVNSASSPLGVHFIVGYLSLPEYAD